jgi:glycosyltransferase involved in cell wall biosynthesis
VSCFSQDTEFSFEILLVDDHSIDETLSIASEFTSSGKIVFRVINSRGNGISEALNTGISASTAPYIIRLDADDVMKPRRIQDQISYMSRHPEIILLGGQIDFISEFPIERKPNFYPCSDASLRQILSKGCYFAHPTVVFRKSFVEKVGGYNPKFDGAEDYELWLLLSQFGFIENLNMTLINYRVHPGQFTVSKRRKSLIATTRVRIYFIFNLGRFRKTNGTLKNSISKCSMATSLLIEVVHYLYRQFVRRL